MNDRDDRDDRDRFDPARESPEQPAPDEEPGAERIPEESSRRWRAGCMGAAVAVVALLIFTWNTWLSSPDIDQSPPFAGGDQAQVQDPATRERVESFVVFGEEYFAIAARADALNEAGFEVLDRMMQGSGSIDDMHNAFRKAANGNAEAAEEYKALQVPTNLLAQDELRRSLDTMSEAYVARQHACETLVGWNGDTDDQQTANVYRRHVDDIDRLTREGLTYLGRAADENGLTGDDVQRFLPSQSSTMRTDIFPQQ